MSLISFKNGAGGRTFANAVTIGDLPPEIVMTLGTLGGDRTAACIEWREKLDFNVNPRAGADYLVRTGGWHRYEVKQMTPDTISAIILWLACCEFVEYVRDAAGTRGSRALVLS